MPKDASIRSKRKSSEGAAVSILILAHPGDRLALQVASRMQRRLAPGRIRIVSPATLAFAPGWVHRLSGASCESEIRLHDGTVLASSELDATWCRLQAMNLPHFAAAPLADRDYAAMEWFALVLSFLAGLRRVVNPVTPQGLSGPSLSPMGWALLASRAGLPVAQLQSATSQRRFPPKRNWLRVESLLPAGVVGGDTAMINDPPWACMESTGSGHAYGTVVGEDVIGELPEELKEGCRRLARLACLDILRCHFLHASTVGGTATKQWLFSNADPFPLQGDATLVSAIDAFLTGDAGTSQYSSPSQRRVEPVLFAEEIV